MPVRYGILGPLRATAGGGEVDLGPAKQRAVLALLLLEANRPVPAAAIVDAVWADDPPENGANVVQKHIAGLRRALEPDRSPRAPSSVLTLDGAGYRLLVEPGALDTDTFDSSVRGARALLADGDPGAAATALRSALLLWRGQALAGFGGRVFDTARRRLDDTRGAAWELLAEAELALGRHASLGAELARVVEEFPAREELRGALLLALYRQGRQAEALTAFREARDYLHDEFGVEPGERLQDLHRRILRSDASLALPAAAPAPAVSPAPAVVVPVPAQPAAVPPVVVHLSAPAARRVDLSGRAWMKAVLFGGIAFGSLGWLTWLVIGIVAWVRRSWGHGAAAVLYAMCLVGMIVLIESGKLDPESDLVSVWDVYMAICVVVPMLAGALHGVLLAFVPRPAGGATGEVLADEVREANRQQARQILTYRPDIAAELGIGRPDLIRWYDDGGLLDVNAVPEALLVTLPGVTAEMAHDLAAERARGGPFGSPEDLVARGALPRRRADALRPLLIFGAGTPTTALRRD
ncbi:BTAD domain-containing putative transcriptional regulator [Catenuloplanes indicus]|uniref:DNA-binding SARP family transcriptional activator n=1 Tax=Catenuloplanes indicus TaxID=137267 RepID=A0AAE4AXR3_9ACTN|nr:BTAD domain-containing putative transcriptional regulator [Catenuloplanes indicus]MDQ0366497.1 DNA-binding SARP family transcriptional activator [Catenuloplanes indicus]